jgi:hypothetical protein
MFEFNYGWRILKGRKLHTFVSLIGLKHVRIHIILQKIFHEKCHPWVSAVFYYALKGKSFGMDICWKVHQIGLIFSVCVLIVLKILQFCF